MKLSTAIDKFLDLLKKQETDLTKEDEAAEAEVNIKEYALKICITGIIV